MDVRIDTDAGDLMPCGLHANVRHFRTDAGQFEHQIVGWRYVRIVAVDENAGGALQEFGLILEQKKTDIIVE